MVGIFENNKIAQLRTYNHNTVLKGLRQHIIESLFAAFEHLNNCFINLFKKIVFEIVYKLFNYFV
jgi:hypothetical protein